MFEKMLRGGKTGGLRIMYDAGRKVRDGAGEIHRQRS